MVPDDQWTFFFKVDTANIFRKRSLEQGTESFTVIPVIPIIAKRA